jgi:carboxypeptidase PM20D1
LDIPRDAGPLRRRRESGYGRASNDSCRRLTVITIAAATAAIRTATFAPAVIADGRDIRLAPVPAYDLDAAVANLGAVVRIRSISHQEAAAE